MLTVVMAETVPPGRLSRWRTATQSMVQAVVSRGRVIATRAVQAATERLFGGQAVLPADAVEALRTAGDEGFVRRGTQGRLRAGLVAGAAAAAEAL